MCSWKSEAGVSAQHRLIPCSMMLAMKLTRCANLSRRAIMKLAVSRPGMIGTTRSRVSHFIRKVRNLALTRYNGKNAGSQVTVECIGCLDHRQLHGEKNASVTGVVQWQNGRFQSCVSKSIQRLRSRFEGLCRKPHTATAAL